MNSKTLLSDKTKLNEKITLVEDETVTTQDEQNAELWNISFSKAAKNLKRPKFSNSNPLAEKLSDPTLKAILKNKNHPSIVTIRNANNFHFHFNEVSVEEIYNEIRKSSPRKSTYSTDTPIRELQENADIFEDIWRYLIFEDFSMSPLKILHLHPF